MNRRSCLKMMSGAAAASMGTNRRANAQKRNPARDGYTKPHIVIFNPDQFRAEALGHHGNPVAVTPNLDRMALTDGVSFSNEFCQNPVCTPSRCSFMTGRYPHTRSHRTMHYMLHEDEPVLFRTLKDNGYYV